MKNWKKVKLSDVADTNLGKMLDKAKNKGKLHPYLANVNVRWGDFALDNLSQMRFEDNEQDKYGLQYGDLVICEGGEPGRCAIWKNQIPNMKIQKALHRVRPRKTLDNRFLYYWLNLVGRKRLLEPYFTGSTIKHLPEDKLKSVEISLPVVGVQKSIADTLSALDEKIELNNRINAALEETARSLYDYWFVQFDFPDENKRPYKSAGGEMVFNASLNRHIPKGWNVGNLADNPLTDIIKPGINRFDGQKIYLPTAAIEGDKITDTSNLITFDNREGRANMQPASFSVWFAKMKNTRKVLYFGDYSAERMAKIILSTGMLGLQCKPTAMEYVWGFANNAGFEAAKNQLSHGATQEGVNNADLEHFPFLSPAQDVLERYSALVGDIYRQKYLNEQESERLAQIRDFLLPILMNGQVAV